MTRMITTAIRQSSWMSTTAQASALCRYAPLIEPLSCWHASLFAGPAAASAAGAAGSSGSGAASSSGGALSVSSYPGGGSSSGSGSGGGSDSAGIAVSLPVPPASFSISSCLPLLPSSRLAGGSSGGSTPLLPVVGAGAASGAGAGAGALSPSAAGSGSRLSASQAAAAPAFPSMSAPSRVFQNETLDILYALDSILSFLMIWVGRIDKTVFTVPPQKKHAVRVRIDVPDLFDDMVADIADGRLSVSYRLGCTEEQNPDYADSRRLQLSVDLALPSARPRFGEPQVTMKELLTVALGSRQRSCHVTLVLLPAEAGASSRGGGSGSRGRTACCVGLAARDKVDDQLHNVAVGSVVLA